MDNIVEFGIGHEVTSGVKGSTRGMHDTESRASVKGITRVKQSSKICQGGGIRKGATIVEIPIGGKEDDRGEGSPRSEDLKA